MNRAHVGLALLILIGGALWHLNMTGVLPSLDMIREQRMMIESYLMENMLLGVIVFSLIYIGAVALSVPIATPLTLLSGFLFGAVLGLAVVVVAATIGSTVTFTLVRYFFYESFTQRLGSKMTALNEELKEHGFRSVLLLRLAPIFPFFVINAGAGLTKIRLRDYVFATALGIVPFSFVLVLAGRRLGEIMSIGDVISFETVLVVSLVVVAFMIPVITRRHRLENSQD